MHDSLMPYFESALMPGAGLENLLPPNLSPLRLALAPPNAQIRIAIGPMMETAGRIGRLTHDLHVALASSSTDTAFTPERYTLHYQKQFSHGMRRLLDFLYCNFWKPSYCWKLHCKSNLTPFNVADR